MDLGASTYFEFFGVRQDIRSVVITPEQRRKHFHVVGATESGKSSLLMYMLAQDIEAGRGVCLIDPHGDLSKELIRLLRNEHECTDEDFWSNFTYFQPSNPLSTISYNVLKTDLSPYAAANQVIESIRRAWPEALAVSPRFSDTLTFALMTLIYNDLTLNELQDCLTNKLFREHLLCKVPVQAIRNFFRSRYEKWGGRNAPLMYESILNKLSPLLLNPHLGRVFGSQQNLLQIPNIMNQGGVLIVDLGGCNDTARSLLGNIIISEIEQTAQRRAIGNRRDFYLYVDEIQSICSNTGRNKTVETILSERRKFGLFITLAHQHFRQLAPELIGTILTNTKNKLVLNSDYDEAKLLSKRLFTVDPLKIKHEAQNIKVRENQHPLYYSLDEQWLEHIQKMMSLETQQAFFKKPGMKDATKIKVPNLQFKYSEQDASDMIQLLITSKGVSLADIDKHITERERRHYAFKHPQKK
ncbi:MAG: DUF87 domain-containing protein [Chloroflexota bacterium]